jgi:hypothetical protein
VELFCYPAGNAPVAVYPLYVYLFYFIFIFSAGLLQHLEQVHNTRQSMQTLLHTVSTHHAEYVGITYTCTRRAILSEQRILKLLNLIRTWFYVAAEENTV